jgi:hypothetical protein
MTNLYQLFMSTCELSSSCSFEVLVLGGNFVSVVRRRLLIEAHKLDSDGLLKEKNFYGIVAMCLVG